MHNIKLFSIICFSVIFLHACENRMIFECSSGQPINSIEDFDNTLKDLNEKLESSLEISAIIIPDDDHLTIHSMKWIYKGNLNDFNFNEIFYRINKSEDEMVITIDARDRQDLVSVYVYPDSENLLLKDNHITLVVTPSELGYEILKGLCDLFLFLQP